MTGKLILRNVRRSLKDYAVYFLTICLAVSMFYAFNSISSQPAMGNLSKSMAIWGQALNTYIVYLSRLLSIVLAALILYANAFIMKRKSKELAVYTTLGMPQTSITGIFISEILFIGIAALAAGIGAGFFLSQALSALAVQLFVGDVGNLTLEFSFLALKETILTFLGIYLAVILLSVRSIYKMKLIDMLKQERINQEITIRNKNLSIIGFLASALCLAISIYFLRTKGITRNILGFEIVLMGAGITLFFYSISTVIVSVMNKFKGFYYQSLNSFLIKQISSKLRINMWVMVILTGLLMLSITVLGVGLSVTGSFNQRRNNIKNIDFTFAMFHKKEDPEKLFRSKGINPASYVKKSERIAVYSSPMEYAELLPLKLNSMNQTNKEILNGAISMIKESDYNKLLLLIGEEKIELSKEEYYMNANYSFVLPYYKAMLQHKTNIKIFGTTIRNKNNSILNTDIMVNMNKNNPGVLIVDDSVVKGLKPDFFIWNAKMLSKKAEEDFYDKINDTFLKNSMKGEIYYASREVADNAYIGIFGVLVFICSYMGLILIIVTLAVLALQQLTETQENRKRYLTLTKIGASKQMLQKTINKQIGIYFIAPLIPAFILSIFVIKAVLKKLEPFFGMELGMNLVISTMVILAMYFIYYVVTCITAHNIMIEKRISQ